MRSPVPLGGHINVVNLDMALAGMITAVRPRRRAIKNPDVIVRDRHGDVVKTMAQPKANMLCPCESGKKFKRCHGKRQ